jgi:heterodisulfide reductase subunit C
MSDFTDPNTLSERVKAIPGGEMLMMCYSCGTCTSKCMIQTKLEGSYNPRRLIREAVFNMNDDAFADKTIWLCTACDLCYPACPQKIHISGVINAVKALAVESGKKTPYQVAKVDESIVSPAAWAKNSAPTKRSAWLKNGLPSAARSRLLR